MNIRRLRAAVLLLALLVAAPAFAAPRCDTAPAPDCTDTITPGRQLVVGVKTAPPFVVRKDGHYSGLSVHLWQEVAADHGWTYTYKPYSLEGLLQAVQEGKVDVALGAITATAAREREMNFAHTITSSGLGVAMLSQQSSGWLAVARALFSPAFLSVIGGLALLLLIVGALAWFLERKRNAEQFGAGRKRGIFSGFWWAIVTMTTVGYGDIAPRTVGGRVLAMVWMITALIITSFFTAAITSALTVGQLKARVTGADELSRLQVCSVPGSTSAQWLEARHIEYRHAHDLAGALRRLRKRDCQAVVYDKPLLHWMINRYYKGKLRVLPLTLARQDYAFALPRHSPLREAIDTSLLKRINGPDWPALLKRYMDAESGGD